MNKNSNRVCKVVSKYFVNEAVMDDSSSDFQENKRIKLGPKTIGKGKRNNKKKLRKRSKDQKDIRSLIKKNELVSFSQDFDQVCKQSGVDVDAEQLQLAIALSKSLNELQSSSKDVEIENRQLSSQERSAKIRTTLQEYGFKVNNTKVLLSLTTNKRKKYNKHSKLLQISNEERQEKISKKYSKVLAGNICKSDEDPKSFYLEHTIIYKATNIPYEHIKNNEVFYVSNLIDRPTHKTCLLKDWSEIPGRPGSPKTKQNDVNFDNIQCSQDELDNILSGSVDAAQKIVNGKQYTEEKESILTDAPKDYIYDKYNETIEVIEPITDSNTNKPDVLKITDIDVVREVQINYNHDRETCMKHSIQRNIDNSSPKSLKVIDSQTINSKQIRSSSPDLFDESSFIDDFNTIEANEVNSREYNSHNDTRDNISKRNCYQSFMDLTEFPNIDSNFNVPNVNITKRKSNDRMDITDCVGVKCNNSDVLSSCENEDKVKDVELVDLTQIPYFISDLPDVKGSARKKDVFDVDTVIYDNVFTKAINESIDLQASIILCDGDSISENVVEEKNITARDNAVKNTNNSSQNVEIWSENIEFHDKNNDNINIDLTQNAEQTESHSLNVYDDCGSETVKHNSASIREKDILKSVTFDNDFDNQDEDIDLTQDSEKSFEITEQYNAINCPVTSYNNSSENVYGNVGSIDDKNNTLSVKNIVNTQRIEENSEDDKIDLTQYTEEIEGENTASGYLYLENKKNTKLGKNNKNNSILSVRNIESHSEPVEDTDDKIDLTQATEEIEKENTASGYLYLENKKNTKLGKNRKNNSILSVRNIESHSEPVEDTDDKIDLTQATEEIEKENTASGYLYLENKNNTKLGKIDNISIDYDEMFDEIASETGNKSKDIKSTSGKDDNSDVFEISDKELNYSIHHSVHENFNIDLENTGRVLKRSINDSFPTVSLVPLTPIKEKKSQTNTPIKINTDIGDAIIQTPKNNEYIIKTRDVTPMADYEAMTSPERNEELEKYGLKPFKRKRAIQLLTYVYNQTHPVIESCSSEEGPSKRIKINNKNSSPKKNSKSPKKCLNLGSDVNKENDIFIVTKETPDIKNIECDPKEWVFQNREKAKVYSCRVPLHIAFHNYVSCRRLLKEAILRYEPVNIDVIHKDLVSYGHKYNPKDLLKFMDRKCITVKTAENNLKNKK